MARNTLEILINAKDNASKTLTGVKRAVSGLNQNLKTVGKVALGGLGALTGAATAAGGAMLKLAADSASGVAVREAFDGIAESAGTSGDAMLAALEKGSAGMINQRDLMLSFNKASQLVSEDFAKELPDAMGYLNKVSAATGQDMNYMMDSLVTGVGRMSPMILDNLGIQVSLAEAAERAADMFGVEADELTEAQKQSGLMNVVMEKLAENTASMPDVTESAAASIAQLRTQFQNAKAQLGEAFLPVLTRLMSLLAEAAQTALPYIISAAEWLGQTIARWVPTFGQVRETIGQLIARIREFLAPIMQALEPVRNWISNNVELKDVLIGLGIAIASVVIPAIASVVTAIAPVIATFAAVTAAVAVVRKAWEEDWGGIRTWMTEFWNSTLQPILSKLVQWLKVNIPVAIQAVARFWNETLKPALQAIWQFLKENIVPILKVLVEIYIKLVITYFTVLAGIFTNVVLPAAKKIWEAMKTMAGVVSDTLGPAVKWLNDKVFKPLSDRLGGIKGFFEKILSLLEKFKSKLDNLELPPWLTPGSPTPFETGLRGIADAMGQLNRMDMPLANLQGGGQATSTTTNAITVPITIQGNADAEQVQEAARAGVLAALRANGAI